MSVRDLMLHGMLIFLVKLCSLFLKKHVNVRDFMRVAR